MAQRFEATLTALVRNHRMHHMNARRGRSGGARRNHLTIRNLPPELAEALEAEKRRRGNSLNQTVIDLLAGGLGIGAAARRSNGLTRLAGTWSAEQLNQFEEATAATEQVDEEMWR